MCYECKIGHNCEKAGRAHLHCIVSEKCVEPIDLGHGFEHYAKVHLNASKAGNRLQEAFKRYGFLQFSAKQDCSSRRCPLAGTSHLHCETSQKEFDVKTDKLTLAIHFHLQKNKALDSKQEFEL